MNPNWIGPIATVAGLIFNAGWSWANLRWERRTDRKIEALKAWADERFLRKPPAPARSGWGGEAA
jgi:hypothetical protein